MIKEQHFQGQTVYFDMAKKQVGDLWEVTIEVYSYTEPQDDNSVRTGISRTTYLCQNEPQLYGQDFT